MGSLQPFPAEPGDPGARLRQVLGTRQQELLRQWTGALRTRQIATDMTDEEIADHLPQILTQITRLLGRKSDSAALQVERLGEAHAIDRLTHGFALDQVMLEYRLLRRIIMDTWARDIGGDISLPELRALDEAIDESIVQAVVQYTSSRERMLKGLNEVSEAAARTSDLDAFLRALLKATLETVPCVDTAVVLVREGERLEVRAAIGLEEELERRFSVAMGEGFAGRVAELVEPAELSNAALDAIVKSPVIHASGVKALYGVPLVVQGGDVIGVAHIGSLGTTGFPEESKLLFRAMASRAASYIAKARLRMQLEQASEVNQKLYHEARDAVVTRDELLAIVSHDLRNQLGVVANSSELLAHLIPQPGSEVDSVLTTMRRASVAMRRLVEDLLDTAAIRSGNLSISLAPASVESLLRRACELHKGLAEAAGIQLQCRDAAAQARVLCDEQRILQVFGNLIGNALRHCRPGDLVQLTARRSGDEIIFGVQDTGPGIPRSVQAHLFTPYHSGAREGKGGTGLGLYISRGIMERQGGRLWHEAGEVEGTAFYFALAALRAA